MTRLGSPRKPGRVRLRGWRLAALVGVAAAVGVAGCGSGGGSSSSPAAAPSATGSATGTIYWWASPISSSGTDVR